MSEFRTIPPKLTKDEWNALLDHGLEKPLSYVIRKVEAEAQAVNGRTGKIDFRGTDANTVIQSALDALTSGRTWKEKVVLKGNFELAKTGAPQLRMPSYTIFESHGKVRLADGINQDMIQNKDTVNGNIQIEIIGGIYDGNRAGNLDGGRGINLFRVDSALIKRVEARNTRREGIQIRGGSETPYPPSQRIKLIENRVVNCLGYSFALYGNFLQVIGNEVFKDEVIAADHFNISGTHNCYVGNLVHNLGGGDGDGFAITALHRSLIASNVLVKMRNGIWFYDAAAQNTRVTVLGNYIEGQGADGVYGINLHQGDAMNKVHGNHVCGFHHTTYGYGIVYNSNYNFITNNDVLENRMPMSGTGLHNIIRRNRGHVTENSGTATIPAGATSVTVAHGLAATPRVAKHCPRANLGAVWVSARDGTNITLNVATAPAADTITDWEAEL